MEEVKNNINTEKEKIRNRYKGIDPQRITVIPAVEKEKDEFKIVRVAVYVRVSTDDIAQTSSFELQCNHYRDLVKQHTNWVLVDIYADEGISGTSLNHRVNFLRMMEDCYAGKVDLIITKSVARFARNTLDCLEHVRKLKDLKNPVGVFFETEGINTLDQQKEMFLTFLATLAQEESHNKSDIMNSSINMRFRRGIFLTPAFLGYDLNEDGNLVINQEEAKAVKLIFYMYLVGSTYQQIANTLEEYGFKTKKGNTKWSQTSIKYILQNERNCGDLLARKTYTPNYLNHKSKKNLNSKAKYHVNEHHEGIISRDDFMAVQRLISNSKYGNTGFLPELKVINSGLLKGFVIIHPKWGSFTEKDYISASNSVFVNETGNIDTNSFTVYEGDFDLRKYEVARLPYIETLNKICTTFSLDKMIFNSESVRKYSKTLFVEMLLHPTKRLFVVRPCNQDSKYANKWALTKGGIFYPKLINGRAFIKVIYSLMGWNQLYKYKINGVKKDQNNESFIIFNLAETEILIPQDIEEQPLESIKHLSKGTNRNIKAFPVDWSKSFGDNYYRHRKSDEISPLIDSEWDINNKGIVFSTHEPLNITSSEEIFDNIDNIKKEQEIKTDEQL